MEKNTQGRQYFMFRNNALPQNESLSVYYVPHIKSTVLQGDATTT